MYPEAVKNVFELDNRAFTTQEVRRRLECPGRRPGINTVLAELRKLQQLGEVTRHKGRWQLAGGFSAAVPTALHRAQLPDLSPYARRIIFGDADGESIKQQDSTESALTASHRWQRFRNLVRYYQDCVRNEEGAEAQAFLNQHGKTFIHCQGAGSWLPRPDMPWVRHLALGAHLDGFVRQLAQAKGSGVLLLGYPLHVVCTGEGQDIKDFCRPIFLFPLAWYMVAGSLTLQWNGVPPSVSMEWMKHALKGESQRSFLTACGLFARPDDDVEAEEAPAAGPHPGMDLMVNALGAFASGNIRERLDPSSVPNSPVKRPFETGIYNRAVIMIGERTRYQRTLLKELDHIAQASDAELEQTALAHIFGPARPEVDTDTTLAPHEGCVLDRSDLQLNNEQRIAVQQVLEAPVAVITGPPGTGKSQVVAGAMANARLRGKSVLLSSRNHKAIDAVVPRLVDGQGRSLIIRANDRTDPSLKYDFRKAIQDLLSRPADMPAREKCEQLTASLETLLQRRGAEAVMANRLAEIEARLGELEASISRLDQEVVEAFQEAELQPQWAARAYMVEAHLVWLQQFAPLWRQERGGRVSLGRRLEACWRMFKVWAALRGMPLELSRPWPSHKGIADFLAALPELQDACAYVTLRLQQEPMELESAQSDDRHEVIRRMDKLTREIAAQTEQALENHAAGYDGFPPQADREHLANLRKGLSALATGLTNSQEARRTRKQLAVAIPELLQHAPLWAVTSLSVGSRLPLLPGIFDLAIIDEASQSDIASAIPILFRAKRAAVVGDPHQLNHTSSLTPAKEVLLRTRHGLTAQGDQRFAFHETSLYDLCAETNNVTPVFLCETYRSAEDIAGYSNNTFYKGRLRVATNHAALDTPPGYKAGIHWTEVQGEFHSGQGGGCFCPQEAQAVADLVRSILVQNNFEGTLGVVTPFRQQANSINDLLDQQIPPEKRAHAQLQVDTAHGFQGDERSVIIFSLCGGAAMPRGSRGFLGQCGNLFNVAASRARAVLHIVGDRQWARRCGLPHVENLAVSRPQAIGQALVTGEWAPHESCWEKRLFDALRAKGLEPVPQHQVSFRRLDMALLREDGLKLDIEVDGDRYHRAPDGSRKIEDSWRDIQLMAMGWKVLRFWVWQLRTDMEGCVARVIKAWSDND